MSQQDPAHNREELYNRFDDYADKRRAEIDKHSIGPKVGLLKSYVLETSRHNGLADIPDALGLTDFQVMRIGKEELFSVASKGEDFGYAEPLGERHLVLHTQLPNQLADKMVERLIKQTASLDALWLAGDTFHQFLRHVIEPNTPGRHINMKFEHTPNFIPPPVIDTAFDNEDEQLLMDLDSEEGDEDLVNYEGRWIVSFVQQARRLAQNLPEYQRIDPSWRAIKMLRFPASKQGGYDLWSWGKMTYRASSFREGRSLLVFVSGLYEKVTRAIEETIWLEAEPTKLLDQTYHHLRGLPVVFKFATTLSDAVFNNFIEVTFDRGQGPFRLWGNPIWLGNRKVHVYGLDLHLWQKLYMELTPTYFLFVLPKGTCGNTVHRLMTNLQRFVDPAVTMTIGSTDYAGLIENALRNREVLEVLHD